MYVKNESNSVLSLNERVRLVRLSVKKGRGCQLPADNFNFEFWILNYEWVLPVFDCGKWLIKWYAIPVSGYWRLSNGIQFFSSVGKKYKKIPPYISARGYLWIILNKLTATGTTSLAAATITTIDGVGWTDWKSRPHAGIHKINLDWSTGIQQTVVNQECKSILLILCISFFWLIQSQSQRWARSATAHDCYTQGQNQSCSAPCTT